MPFQEKHMQLYMGSNTFNTFARATDSTHMMNKA